MQKIKYEVKRLILQKTAEMRVHSDLLQVLLFLIIFIVIHIIIVHHTNRNLQVTLKQKIVLDDGPVIKLKSASRSKLKQAAEKEYEAGGIFFRIEMKTPIFPRNFCSKHQLFSVISAQNTCFSP